MGLLDKLGNLLNSKKNANLLVVGLDNSGKTSIINFLKPGDTKLVSIAPTVGFNVEKFFAKNFNFTTFDMSGQSRYRNLWEHYYREADAIIFVVDSSDRMRLVVSREELESMLNHSDLRNRNTPILIFANKSDIKGAISSNDVRGELDLDKIRNRPWRIFSSNALNGDGISEGVEWLVQEIKSVSN